MQDKEMHHVVPPAPINQPIDEPAASRSAITYNFSSSTAAALPAEVAVAVATPDSSVSPVEHATANTHRNPVTTPSSGRVEPPVEGLQQPNLRDDASSYASLDVEHLPHDESGEHYTPSPLFDPLHLQTAYPDDNDSNGDEEGYALGWNAPYYTGFCGCLSDPMLSLDVCCCYSCYSAKQLAALQGTPSEDDIREAVRRRYNGTTTNGAMFQKKKEKEAAELPPPPPPQGCSSSSGDNKNGRPGTPLHTKRGAQSGRADDCQPLSGVTVSRPFYSAYDTECWMYVFSLFCCGPASIRIRRHLRVLYGKNESMCQSIVRGCCCPYCSLCQTYRELHAQGVDLHGQIACPVLAEPRPVMW